MIPGRGQFPSPLAAQDGRQKRRELSVAAIKKLGGDVIFEDGELFVFMSGPDFTDAALNHLTPLTELGWLDLSRTAVTAK
jgi:hypothetical protein